MATKKSERKRRSAVAIDQARAVISSTFNNTIVTITDASGNTIAQSSGGRVGHKNSKKSTPFAAQTAAEAAAAVAKEYGVIEIEEVVVKGPGPGRESAIRALGKEFEVKSIIDRTPLPHNGCREPEKRRV